MKTLFNFCFKVFLNMAKERVQKSFGQSSSKKKHTPLVPPIVDHPTQANSQLSPKVKPSRIPSLEERDAIKRKIFDSISRSGENQAMREGLFSPTVRVQNTPDSASAIGMPIQPKLTIGAPGDKYELEADRVAAQVVNQINAPVAQQSHENLQREEMSVEEEELQMKPMVQLQPGAGGMTATPEVETSIQQARGGGHSLADNIREPMEQAFNADFSGVKVHTDAQADQLNQSIQAKAFTTGQDVFFRSGEYNPGSRGGQELIAHELTHVVQQNGRKNAPIQRVYQKNKERVQNANPSVVENSTARVTEFGANWEKRSWRDHIKALGLKLSPGAGSGGSTESGKTIFLLTNTGKIVCDLSGYWRHELPDGGYADKNGLVNANNAQTHFWS